jgi:hypothetical protein
VVNHHVRRLDVAVDDAVRVDKVQGSEQLEGVMPDVGFGEARVELVPGCCFHIFGDEAVIQLRRWNTKSDRLEKYRLEAETARTIADDI